MTSVIFFVVNGSENGGNVKLGKVSSHEGKAYQLYLKGRALNVLPDHSPEAETLLSRSVKLDPTLVEAWNELGECYWKRGDIETAKTCFEGALNHVNIFLDYDSLSSPCFFFSFKD